jgi:hypothetical protein
LVSRLHEKNEPLPWGEADLRAFIGKWTVQDLYALYKRGTDLGIVICNGCGRWQDFPPPYTFAAVRAAATAAGWRRADEDDLCPLCVGNEEEEVRPPEHGA